MLQGEHSAILSTFIKLPFAIKTFILSIFEWSLKTGFTVVTNIDQNIWLSFLIYKYYQSLKRHYLLPVIYNKNPVSKIISVVEVIKFQPLLSCQPWVTVTSRFVYKVIRALEWIDHLCINPILGIGLIHKWSIDSHYLNRSLHVSVLLSNCKQSITSLSLLVGTTVGVCQKCQDKQCRPRSKCFWRSSLIRVFPLCYSGLFDLILYIPSTIFQFYRDESSWVEPVLS